jgi:hypothetical protein
MAQYSNWKWVTAGYPTQTLILVARAAVKNYVMLAQQSAGPIETYHPWCSTDSEQQIQKKKNKRWKHFFDVCNSAVWIKVILWAPLMQSGDTNAEEWGYLHVPSLIGHRNIPIWQIERRRCVPSIPTLCSVPIKSLSSLYSAPETEQTLIDFDEALRKRVDLYCKLKSKALLTDADVLLSSERDINLDRLGFNAVLLGLNNRIPGVLACRRSLETTLFRDTALADFIRYEGEIAIRRLTSCLSTQIIPLFLAQYADVVEFDKSEEARLFPRSDEVSMFQPFTWVYAEAKTLNLWVCCPFETAFELIAHRLVWLYQGNAILHVGHVLYLVLYRLVRETLKSVTRAVAESLGDEFHDDRLISLLKHQLGRIWQTVGQGAAESGFARDSVPLSDLKAKAPPCVIRMLLSLDHKGPSLQPLNHQNEFFFITLCLRYGVKPEELIEVLQARIPSTYPRSEWDSKRADVRYQVEYLDRKRKPYSQGCKLMQVGDKPWCVYTKQNRPQHICATKLKNSDHPVFITSPWAFIVERKKTTNRSLSYTA